MASLADVKDYILSLSEKEKDKLILHLLKKAPETVDQLYYKHVADPASISLLVEDLKSEIRHIIRKHVYKGGIVQKNLAKGISEAATRIAKYKG